MFNFGFGGFPFGAGDGAEFEEEDLPRGRGGKKKEEDNSLYELLEVERNATTAEIRKQFKKKAMKMHPDKGGDPEKFKELAQAYDILNNEDKRKVYDKYGMDGIKEGAGVQTGSPFDIFENLFGMGGHGGGGASRKEMKKGKPQLKELKVTLEDVYNGKLVKVPHKRRVICEECDGKGGANVKECQDCKGRGMVTKMVQLGPGMYSQSTQHCSKCKGEGKIMNAKDKCKKCKGEKVIEIEKVIDVGLEAGVPDEHDYVYTGECDEYPGVMGGDLHLRVQIQQHKNFVRKGADLFYEKKITLLEALTGVQFTIQHLDKSQLKIATVPNEIISHNEQKIVKHKGMPFYNDPMCYGHLIIKFIVEFPKRGELKSNQIEQLKKILPGPKHDKPAKGAEVEYLDDFNETDLNPNAEGGSKKHRDEDEDDERYHGGQRVQCQQQ